MDGEWFDTPKNIASISNSGDISCNTLTSSTVYTKSYIDASLNTNYYTKSVVDEKNTNGYNFIMEQIDASRYSKSLSDANYYNKTYVDASYGSVYTNNQCDGNYYGKTYIDSSFNSVYIKTESNTN